MAAIERRHERMYMVSQALLVFRTSLVSDSKDDYWVQKARTLLNLTLQEATDLFTFTKKQSIKEYVEWVDEL